MKPPCGWGAGDGRVLRGTSEERSMTNVEGPAKQESVGSCWCLNSSKRMTSKTSGKACHSQPSQSIFSRSIFLPMWLSCFTMDFELIESNDLLPRPFSKSTFVPSFSLFALEKLHLRVNPGVSRHLAVAVAP